MGSLLDKAKALLSRGGWRGAYASPTSPQAPRSRLPRCNTACGAKVVVSLALVSSITLVALTFDVSNFEGLLLWVKENKLEGSLLFLLLYMLAIVLMVPAMVMALCAGAIFGAVAGTLIVWVGSSVGQVLAFVVGRYLLRDMVLRFLTQQYPKWGAIDRALEREGWKLVTLLRLSPIAPWNVLNYALAVTAVPLFSYAVASSLAVLPYLVMFVYFGSLARTLSDIFEGLAGPDPTTTALLGAVSCLVMVAIVWYTTNMAKKAIREALVEEGDAEVAENASHDLDMLSILRGEQALDSGAGDPDCNGGCDGGSIELGRTYHSEMVGLTSGGGTWSPRSGGVAATVRVVGSGGAQQRSGGSGTTTAAAGGEAHTAGGGTMPHQVQVIPLVSIKETVLAEGKRPAHLSLTGGETLQQHVRSSGTAGSVPGLAGSATVSPRVTGVV